MSGDPPSELSPASDSSDEDTPSLGKPAKPAGMDELQDQKDESANSFHGDTDNDSDTEVGPGDSEVHPKEQEVPPVVKKEPDQVVSSESSASPAQAEAEAEAGAQAGAEAEGKEKHSDHDSDSSDVDVESLSVDAFSAPSGGLPAVDDSSFATKASTPSDVFSEFSSAEFIDTPTLLARDSSQTPELAPSHPSSSPNDGGDGVQKPSPPLIEEVEMKESLTSTSDVETPDLISSDGNKETPQDVKKSPKEAEESPKEAKSQKVVEESSEEVCVLF